MNSVKKNWNASKTDSVRTSELTYTKYKQTPRCREKFYSSKNTFSRKSNKCQKSYIYGNFPSYYGYRNQDCPDTRLCCMKREWLTNKVVLDVGCNAGHFTLSVARDFLPRAIIGIDIDPSLILAAKKNAKHYVVKQEEGVTDSEDEHEFPQCFVSLYGPVAKAMLPGNESSNQKLPYNVSFVAYNYVPESDEMVLQQKSHFDTILCLSVTKWVHFNWGDDGLKRMFRRMYAHIKPGGFLILEAQPLSSYRKKKKLSEGIYQNFLSMSFYPEQFNKYLLEEVGFTTCELIDVPGHSSQGFMRPLYLFTKGYEDVKMSAPVHTYFNMDEDVTSDYSDVDVLSD